MLESLVPPGPTRTPPNLHPIAGQAAAASDPLREAAIELEASFLSEMLGSAGLGAMQGAFGGGLGEDQFASMLRMEQARAMAKSGGIGLAESIYSALLERSGE